MLKDGQTYVENLVLRTRQDFNVWPFFDIMHERVKDYIWFYLQRILVSTAQKTKISAVSCGFGHIYWRKLLKKTSFFVQWWKLQIYTVIS